MELKDHRKCSADPLHQRVSKFSRFFLPTSNSTQLSLHPPLPGACDQAGARAGVTGVQSLLPLVLAPETPDHTGVRCQ